MPYKNKEDKNKASKRWRLNNLEKYRQAQNNWSAKNRDKKRKSSKDWAGRNREKVKNYYLLYEYGITLETFNILFKKQNGVCAICKKEELGKSLAVDHSHNSGEIRGLLCQDCNRGLGMFKDNIELLKKAIDYLYGGKYNRKSD